jgi:type II secretory ATPase GspE/PulE/Tfp pilus assembly ATPase PilB-like protein
MTDLSLPSLSLVPIEDEPRGSSSAGAQQEPFAWPTPPLAAYPLPMCQIEPEPCEVQGRTGNVVQGLMISFDPVQAMVRVQVPPERSPMRMRFAQLRRLVLSRPLVPITSVPMADPGAQALLGHHPSQPYTLHLVGGERIGGSTVGHVETVQGLFLFEPLDDAGTLQRSFVPSSTFERFEIGEPVGALLVQQQAVTPEQVEQTVQAQHKLRSRRIGEMLVARKLVTPDQLLAALDKQARMPIMRLGEALVSLGCLSASQLEEAVRQQDQARSQPLGQMLIEGGYINQAQLQLALARKLGFPVVDLAHFPVDRQILRSVPHALASRLKVLPLLRRGGRLVVAMEDTSRRDLIDEVSAVVGSEIAPALALPGSLPKAIEAAYARITEYRHQPGASRPAPFDDNPVHTAAAQLDEALSGLQQQVVTGRSAAAVPRRSVEPAALEPVVIPRRRSSAAPVAAAPAAQAVPATPEASAPPSAAASAVPIAVPMAAPVAAPVAEAAPTRSRSAAPRGHVPGPADALLIDLVQDALARGASDIHLEMRPGDALVRVRMRRDERLEAHRELPVAARDGLLGLIESLAELSPPEQGLPRQGRLDMARLVPQQALDLRVTLIPTQAGLHDVMLRLPSRLRVLPLDELGFATHDLERLVRLLDRPSGLFLNAGPARSGRSSTMHALLAHLTLPERRIWTAEERIDLVQPELRQVEVRPQQGWGYEQALQAFRLADADVIMVDDIREPGAAREAVELAQAGRLVIAGLPARHAGEALARLVEGAGVRPHDLADALCGVHVQHLLRRVCNHCRMSRSAKDGEVQEWLESALHDLPGDPPASAAESLQRDWIERHGRDGRLRRYHSPGCPRCNHTGYRGRVAVHELLVPSRELRRLIRANAPAWHLQRQAAQDGLRSLHQDALEKMLAGITTHDEVRCVATE